MFNNLFYYVNKLKTFVVEICIAFCLYMWSIIVLRKKIGIGKNQYHKVRLPKNHKIGKGQENCNQCISNFYKAYRPEKRCVL